MKTKTSVLRIVSCLILFALLGSACDKKRPQQSVKEHIPPPRDLIYLNGKKPESGSRRSFNFLGEYDVLMRYKFEPTVDYVEVERVNVWVAEESESNIPMRGNP